MSLYGALNIGVAGLSANSAALSATSSNIANVNTVGYKTQNANFETFLNTSGLVGNASAGVSAVISQDVATQGLPTGTTTAANQEFTRDGSFSPDENGNLKNAAGLYLMGYPLDSLGNVPTNTSTLSVVNISSLSGKASPTDSLGIQANLQSSATADLTYAAGDMSSGAATPDF